MSDDAAPALVTAVQDLLRDQQGLTYRQFLTVPSMSIGLFAAPAGHVDTQTPHRQDEVYVVTEGAAVLDVDGTRTAVSPGSVAFVPAGVPHRFEEITQDLRVLVVFSPPYDGQ